MSASRKMILEYWVRRKTWSLVRTVVRSGRPSEGVSGGGMEGEGSDRGAVDCRCCAAQGPRHR